MLNSSRDSDLGDQFDAESSQEHLSATDCRVYRQVTSLLACKGKGRGTVLAIALPT